MVGGVWVVGYRGEAGGGGEGFALHARMVGWLSRTQVVCFDTPYT